MVNSNVRKANEYATPNTEVTELFIFLCQCRQCPVTASTKCHSTKQRCCVNDDKADPSSCILGLRGDHEHARTCVPWSGHTACKKYRNADVPMPQVLQTPRLRLAGWDLAALSARICYITPYKKLRRS